VLSKKQKTLPQKKGVYVFLDKNNKELYIGKAKNLKKRTAYYFKLDKLPKRLQKMASQAVDLKFFITETENDALLLEAQLIKEKQPVYNILYKSGRTLYYINFSNHQYPRLEIINEWQKNAIGPFLSYFEIKNLISELLKLFKLRTCSDYVFARKKRPCLEYYANRCSAPCVNLIENFEYLQSIESLRCFLNGKTNNVLKVWQKELKEYIKLEQFEFAANKRDQMLMAQKIRTKQSIWFENIKRLDVVVFYENFFYVESIKNGAIINIEYRKYSKKITLNEFLWEFYIEEPTHKIIGSTLKDMIWKNYSSKLNKIEKKIYANALIRMKNLVNEDKSKQLWANILGLDNLEEVEVYDNSHYAGKNALCGMICANTDGEFIKSKYRVWKMPNDTRNDLEILEYSLTKRAYRANYPSMILIDGGKTQLNVALKALHPYENIYAFAKGEKRKGGILYSKKGSIEVNDVNFFLWLEQLRDEAHRWAKKNATIRFTKKFI